MTQSSFTKRYFLSLIGGPIGCIFKDPIFSKENLIYCFIFFGVMMTLYLIVDIISYIFNKLVDRAIKQRNLKDVKRC